MKIQNKICNKKNYTFNSINLFQRGFMFLKIILFIIIFFTIKKIIITVFSAIIKNKIIKASF